MPASDDALTPEIRRVAVVVVVGAVMSILDISIVNVALETLARDLDAPLASIQWVATGYLLALATVIPLTGWAAERFGPRRVWMAAVAAFVATSALCGAAWSAESLIAFRALQGLAGGMIMLAQAAADRSGDERGRRADAARAGHRRRAGRAPVVAVDLLRESPDRARRARPGRAAPPARASAGPLSEVSTHGSVTGARLAPALAGARWSRRSSSMRCASRRRSSTSTSSAAPASPPPPRRSSSRARRSSARCC
jgi:Major Facilitator Superfamily